MKLSPSLNASKISPGDKELLVQNSSFGFQGGAPIGLGSSVHERLFLSCNNGVKWVVGGEATTSRTRSPVFGEIIFFYSAPIVGLVKTFWRETGLTGETGVTRQRSEQFGRAQRQNGANGEGYKRPVDKKTRSHIKKRIFGPKSGIFGPKKKEHFWFLTMFRP